MKFRVIGGPLTSGINVEAKHSDTVKSIFKKVQKAVGKKTSLEGYDLFTSIKSDAAGHYAPAAGPLRSTDTPEAVQLDRKQKDPHVLLLVKRAEGGANGSLARSLSHSNSLSCGAGDGGTQDTESSASVTPTTTPRANEDYRRRMQAMFLKYDPDKVSKVDLALERYAGYEEDVIQQLVKKYGPEPAADEVDTSPPAIARAVAAAAENSTRSDTESSASSNKRRNAGASFRDRLTAIYSTYEPEKLSKVDGTLKHYAGREEEVIQQLLKKYGPEPQISAALPSAETSPAPRNPPAAAVAPTPTTITMSEAPETPPYSLTPRTSSGAADSLPITPRNLQDDYRGSSFASTALSPASADAAGASSSPLRPLTYRDRLAAMYAMYDPSKIRLVDGTLKKYKGREAAVLKQLVKMYGPEPSPENVAAAKEAAAAAARARRVSGSALSPVVASAPEVGEPRLAAEVPVQLTTETAASSPSGNVEVSERDTSPVAAAGPSAVEETVVEGIEPAAPTPIESVPVESNAMSVSPSSPLSPPTEAPSATEETKVIEVVTVKPQEESHVEEEKEPETKGDRYRERLVALYHTYNASKLHTVEGTLRKFAGKEEAAIQQLVRRYGPEPPALTAEEAQELLQCASGSSPMTSPRTHSAKMDAVTSDVPDNASSSPGSSKPVSPVEAAPQESAGYRNRIHAILALQDPDKVDKVDAILTRYQGKEEEVIAKLEQRYGVHKDDTAEASPTLSAQADSSPRPATPPPVSAPTEYVDLSPPATPPSPPTPVESSVAEDATPNVAHVKVGVSDNDDDDATRPTAPPSQRSSSNESSHKIAAVKEDEKASQEKAPEKARVTATPSSISPPPAAQLAGKHAAVVSAQPVRDERPPAAPVAPPAATVETCAPPQQSAPRAKNYAAAAKVAATHLQMAAQKVVVQRYWATWHRHHAQIKAGALVRDELWVPTSPASRPASNRGGYRLNDTVQPPYMVRDLSMVVAQEERRSGSGAAVFSSEVEIAARTLLSALRECVESRVVEVRSEAEEDLARRFLAHWTVAEHLCPVTDSPDFARALHQAAHLISQLSDLMTVIRTQAGQLQQLKALHTDVLHRMESAQTSGDDLAQMQAQLDSANAHRRELEAELKRISSHAGISARSPSRAGRRGSERRASPPTRRVFPTAEERKDAQIAKLQQELAKTRNSLFASKEAEEKMKVQVQQSTAREVRRERDERRREGPPGHHSRPTSALPTTRSHSGPAGQRGRPSSGASSPQRGHPVSATPRGAFSHAIVLDTPRRASESATRVDHNGRAVSSIRRSGVDAQDSSNTSLNSNTPWPVSRFVMAEEVERGPCPNCLTPLTSCSSEVRGAASAKAAFCFSCRRSFTFGELRSRDARDAVDNL